MPDPRGPRGIWHAVASVLAVGTASVLAGCKSVLAIAEWAAEAPQELLTALAVSSSWPGGRYHAPHLAAFRRVLRDAHAVDAVIGSFLAEIAGFASLARADGDPGTAGPSSGSAGSRRCQEREQQVPLAGAVSVDGNTARGARQQDGPTVHLLSALVHGMLSGLVVAQRDVAHKTNEIPEVKKLLEPLDLRGWAVTLDALHCQKETARFLMEDKKAAYLSTAAKDNQPGPAWSRRWTPCRGTTSVPRWPCHVRPRPWPRRTARHPGAACPNGIWPHAAHVFLVERYVYDLHGTPQSAVAALGLTALIAAWASPERLNWLVRGHPTRRCSGAPRPTRATGRHCG